MIRAIIQVYFARIRLLRMDGRRDFRFLELHMLRRINRHLEVRQNVFRDLEFLFERLIAHVGDDLPVTQHR